MVIVLAVDEATQVQAELNVAALKPEIVQLDELIIVNSEGKVIIRAFPAYIDIEDLNYIVQFVGISQILLVF